MTPSLPAMAASLALAGLGAVAATAYYRNAAARPKLALARLDLAAYVTAACGVLTLVPEAAQAFAPEIITPGSLVGTAFERLDYAAFVFVSVSFGLGFTRRWLTIKLEQAS
jgi:hypothetical protein